MCFSFCVFMSFYSRQEASDSSMTRVSFTSQSKNMFTVLTVNHGRSVVDEKQQALVLYIDSYSDHCVEHTLCLSQRSC